MGGISSNTELFSAIASDLNGGDGSATREFIGGTAVDVAVAASTTAIGSGISKGTSQFSKSASTITGNTKTVSPNVKNVLNTIDDLKANGVTIKANDLKLQFNQELNLTFKDGQQILNLRIETHTVKKGFGGNGITPERHLNIEFQPRTVKLPNYGHKFLK